MNRPFLLYAAITLIFGVLCFSTGNTTFAAGLKPPTKVSFGGTVLFPQIPGIVCGAQYWIGQKPAGGFLGMPLYIETTNKSVVANSSILGIANAKPDMKICYIPTPSGPYYIPAWKINTSNFGITKPR